MDSISDLQQRIAQNPQAADVYYNQLGEHYGSQGESGKAIAYFQRAIECNPLCAVYYTNLGLALSNVGAADEALRNYNKALLIVPNRMAYNNRACIYIERGQYAEAVADITAALKLRPAPNEVCNKATLYATRADAYMHMEEYRKALDDLQHGIACCDPDDDLIGFFDSGILRCNMRLGIKPCRK